MTIEAVDTEVARIMDLAARGEHRKAHVAEECLHRAVLSAVARGAVNSAEIAREALRTQGSFIQRYYGKGCGSCEVANG